MSLPTGTGIVTRDTDNAGGMRAMWFTETAWPPMLILISLAAGSGWMWFQRRQSRFLTAALVLIVAAGATWYVEQWIVTDAERVSQAVVDVADAFVRRDVPRTQSFFAQDLQPVVALAFAFVLDVEDLRLTDLKVRMLAENSRARTQFRANGVITIAQGGNIGHHPSRWELTWQKQAGEWQVIKIQRLHPLTGESMGFFAGN